MTKNQPEFATFEDLLAYRFSRRQAIKVGLAATVVGAAPGFTSPAFAQQNTNAEQKVTKAFTGTTTAPLAESATFASIKPQPITDDAVRVPEDYVVDVLLRWGDPVLPGAPSFDVRNQTGESQAQQAGFNHDFQVFFPIGDGSTEGVLWVNHEYTSGAQMFPGYNAKTTDLASLKRWVDVELAAHGGTVVELVRPNANAKWTVKPGRRNRRITAMTPMRFSGPAANDFRLQTPVLGMLNNCGGGRTPWGTVLTCEENFNQYFANSDGVADAVTRVAHKRYGIPGGATERGWEKVYPDRFDAATNPDQPWKYGWVVEVDPDDPNSVPVKRTALGRFKHEAATCLVAPNGQVVVYTGDDERFDYFYKFVSFGKYDPAKGKANSDLLDEGTLYVAKFWADGTAEWIPLVHNRRRELSAEFGFVNQADVLLRTRLAADAVGATKMDRPEDIEMNPVTGKVYVVMTNNGNRRTQATDEGERAANPRFDSTTGNRFGHIIEIDEKNGIHSGMQFNWNVFLLAGDPSAGGSQATALKDVRSAKDTYFAGFTGQVSPIGAPDNIAFSPDGLLWIATDGAPNAIGYNDALHCVPTTGPNRGQVRQFLSVPAGAETCGPEFSPDQKTLFIAVQHPGEDGTLRVGGDPTTNTQSSWPDGPGNVPRPATIAIRHKSGKTIGS